MVFEHQFSGEALSLHSSSAMLWDKQPLRIKLYSHLNHLTHSLLHVMDSVVTWVALNFQSKCKSIPLHRRVHKSGNYHICTKGLWIFLKYTGLSLWDKDTIEFVLCLPPTAGPEEWFVPLWDFFEKTNFLFAHGYHLGLSFFSTLSHVTRYQGWHYRQCSGPSHSSIDQEEGPVTVVFNL